MKLHPLVSSRAPRNGYVCDVATNKKAREEGKDYKYYVISPGYYACKSNEEIYVVEETAKTVGCSCQAMTFRKDKNHADVCKHIVAMGFLDETPATPLTEALKKLFRWNGWIGENFLIPPASYTQTQGRKKKPKPLPPQEPTPDPGRKKKTRQPMITTADRSKVIEAAERHKWDGMSPAQMCEAMDDVELNKNARRGGVAALAEVERRKKEKEASK